MLDEGARALLAAVCGLCKQEGFQIVEEGDLQRSGIAAEAVRPTMALLEEKKLIELRYAEGGIYCVRPLPAGKGYLAREACERKEREKLKRGVFLFAALGALAGGIGASLFAFVLFLLLHV